MTKYELSGKNIIDALVEAKIANGKADFALDLLSSAIHALDAQELLPQLSEFIEISKAIAQEEKNFPQLYAIAPFETNQFKAATVEEEAELANKLNKLRKKIEKNVLKQFHKK